MRRILNKISGVVFLFFCYSVTFLQAQNFTPEVNVTGNVGFEGRVNFIFGGSNPVRKWIFAAPRKENIANSQFELTNSFLFAYDISGGDDIWALQLSPTGETFFSSNLFLQKKLTLQCRNYADFTNNKVTGFGIINHSTINGVDKNEFIYRVSTNLGFHSFYAQNTELMRIQGDGKVGIGTGGTLHDRLHVNNGMIRLTGTNPAAIMTSSPGLRLGSNGANYSWIQSSSAPLALNPVAGVNSYVIIGQDPSALSSLTNLSSEYKLLVGGKILCNELRVKLTGNWPDYVFDSDYSLMPLKSVEKFINEHRHLPNVPSAQEVAENGINSGEMDQILIQKVEELTLYLINQEKAIQKQDKVIEELKKQNELLLQLISDKK